MEHTTLIPPPHPDNLSPGAQWLAGEGAGSWFHLSALAENTDMFSVLRADPHGRTECRGLFTRADGSAAFDARVPFTFTYPSHCAKVTLLQRGQRFTLLPIPVGLIIS